MSNQDFIRLCKEKVAQYFNAKKEKTDTTPEMRPEALADMGAAQKVAGGRGPSA